MTLYELIETAITTKQVRADGTLTPLLARSRRAPMRSAVKRYGTFLGIDADTAGPESYHRPDHEIRVVIETKAPDTLAPNTLRNIGNDLVALLRIGVDQGWLDPLPAPLLSWRQRWPDPERHGVKQREEPICTQVYAISLNKCPAALRDDLSTYLRWCEAPVARSRPRAIVKRPITSQIVQEDILRLAGFAVRHLQCPIQTLTLASLCQPDFLESYINWWIARRGKVTQTLSQMLVSPATIARYWLKDKAMAEAINHMRDSLPPAEAVHRKDRHWLSLETLEEVGQSIYPLNARRLQEYQKIQYKLTWNSGRRTSFYVAMSLMLRLLIRLPMRQRCLREMRFGTNLYQDHAGVWQIRFVGSQLKIDTVGGVINRYEFPFPSDLVALLEEWRTDWRPRLATPDEAHVFLNSAGHAFSSASALGRAFKHLTYRFTGVAVNPHLIRDIWATEYLNATGDIAGCARRLGNTIQMVMKHYAHILKKDADARAETFMQGIFANGESHGHGKTP